MRISYMDMDLDIPRDRNGMYEPQVIKRYQNNLTKDIEEKNYIYVYKRYDCKQYRNPF